ncbi:putative molybdenum cofactor guanylyltransferase [Synergistales bacterium]|nr:putative molybdenum cofactor guanylyltransferase [Synergistales bacterium]
MRIPVCAIILAGGKSSRFGSDKAMFVWRGLTLSARIAEECRAVFDEIIIVRGQRQRPLEIEGVNEVRDIYPNSGPLGGIHAGLSRAISDLAFVVACDMPTFSASLARRLLEFADGFDVVAPHDGEQLQPLCAVYRKSVLPVCAKMLVNGERSVKRLCGQVKTKVVDCKERGEIFSNVNYTSDLSEHF